MSMPKVISMREAAEKIAAAKAMVLAAFVQIGFPSGIFRELAQYLEELEEQGDRRWLEVVYAAGTGNKQGNKGLDLIARYISRILAGHCGLVTEVQKRILAGKIVTHLYPQDVILQIMRDMARGMPLTHSRIGRDLFPDPRISKESFNHDGPPVVELTELAGEEYLAYHHPIRPKVAVLRGGYADEDGNVYLKGLLPAQLELKEAAWMARANDGITIFEVLEIRKNDDCDPHDVFVPFIDVDYIVLTKHEEDRWPTFAGPLDERMVTKIPPTKQKESSGEEEPLPLLYNILGQRAYMELEPKGGRKREDEENQLVVINVGIGNSSEAVLRVIAVAEQLGLPPKQIIATVENGIVVAPKIGCTNSKAGFGTATNPSALRPHPDQFMSYYTGVVDTTVMSSFHMDGRHSNVSWLGDILSGPGGFPGITQSIPEDGKIVLCLPMTAVGLQVGLVDGKLDIIQEGAVKKFVKKVQHETFSFKIAHEEGQKVIVITERCVLEMAADGVLEVTELAPGIDLKTQVLDMIDFEVRVSGDLMEMRLPVFGNFVTEDCKVTDLN